MIDAVITWVDGNDPVHQQKREHWIGPNTNVAGTSETRFSCNGELRFSVLSVLKFCPFVRHIHIVTDAQHPKILDPIFNQPEYSSRLKVVDHKTIFGEHSDLLPVFSSRSIETMMHRIPSLAERFIYLNDDIFVGRPMQISDFFENDLPIVRGQLCKFDSLILRWLKKLKKPGRPGYAAAQRAAARKVGREHDYLLAEHQPHAMRRSTLSTYYMDRSDELRAQIGHRFRSTSQISPIGLSNHLEIAAGAKISAPSDLGYIRRGRDTVANVQDQMKLLNTDALSCLCIQSLDKIRTDAKSILLEGLEQRYAGNRNSASKIR